MCRHLADAARLGRRIFPLQLDRGHVLHEGDGVALAKVPAQYRRRPARDTAQMLAHVHERIDPAHSLDEFILRLIEEDDYRRKIIEELMTDAVQFAAAYEIAQR